MTPADAPRVRVTEIFHSIQGESSFIGQPCHFVRLTGCDLRCRWCDTTYAFQDGQWMAIDQVIRALAALPACGLVEVTGGEPLLQKGSVALMQRLLAAGYRVLLETSGAADVCDVPAQVVRIMDLKAPGSTEVHRNLWSNIAHLQPHDELKVVVADRVDFDWVCARAREHGLLERVIVHLSPVWGELSPRTLAEWILAEGLAFRLHLQMHKTIWSPETRGV